MAQSVLGGLAAVLVLIATALAARQGATAVRGVLLGILAGIIVAAALGFAGGFLGYVLPMGQMEFWLASLLSRFQN